MSRYLKNEIELARHAMHVREPESFDAGLLKGFIIAVTTYGIWRNGFQRIGASDKTIQECIQEFEAALKDG